MGNGVRKLGEKERPTLEQISCLSCHDGWDLVIGQKCVSCGKIGWKKELPIFNFKGEGYVLLGEDNEEKVEVKVQILGVVADNKNNAEEKAIRALHKVVEFGVNIKVMKESCD